MLQSKFIKNLNLLSNYNFTYDLLIYNNQITEATVLLKEVPTLPIVLNHIAKPNIRDYDIKTWESQIKAIAQFKNLSCKISGLATEANWKNWKEADLIPYLDIIVEHFGFDRIMFGSDWPVCLVATSYERWLNFLKNYFSKFSSATQEKFFSGNCTNFYKLNTIN
jgi:L-fuconolactonase